MRRKAGLLEQSTLSAYEQNMKVHSMLCACRNIFTALNQNTEWAKLPSAKRARVEDESDGEAALEAVAQSTQSLTAASTTLQPQNLSNFHY